MVIVLATVVNYCKLKNKLVWITALSSMYKNRRQLKLQISGREISLAVTTVNSHIGVGILYPLCKSVYFVVDSVLYNIQYIFQFYRICI